ncbi:MAG: prolipoprotein diacylglyceryl transferase [Firmicutes bacterium]|nr:prolipoprotein diacylglyceryl transferase [Bacillota bacterium]
MNTPNPIAFSLFGFDIRWYGILIASAMCLAVFISCRRAPKVGIDPDAVLDLAIWMLPIGIIGARAYYVIFNSSIYHSIADVVNIRNGGLAIHGGLIAGLVVLIVICRVKKLHPLDMADLIIPSVALAQSIGRWGNYFNSEAHGGPTDLPWGIMIDGVRVHPTFLYESLWCLLLFFALTHIFNRRSFKGQVVCLYGMLYSIERFFVEALRTDSLMLGPLKQAQVISVFCIIVSALLYIYLRRHAQLKDKE